MSGDRRHSQAVPAELIRDAGERARREAENGLRQFDVLKGLILDWTHPDRPFRLRPSVLLTLNRVALEGINMYAGSYRPGIVKIRKSKHKPPPAHLVPELVENMCDYVNDNLNLTPLHLAAYTMWRLNWIHPFADGNGRTSRAASYFVLCARSGHLLPGTKTIPHFIVEDRGPYYEALEFADEAWKGERVDVSSMEDLLGALLAKQLVTVHREIVGTRPTKNFTP